MSEMLGSQGRRAIANQAIKITQAAQDTASCKCVRDDISAPTRFAPTARFEWPGVGIGIQALTGKLPTQASSLCPLVPQPLSATYSSPSTGRPRPLILRSYSNQTPLRKLESHSDAAAHAVLCVTSPRTTTKFHNPNKLARKESKYKSAEVTVANCEGARNTQRMTNLDENVLKSVQRKPQGADSNVGLDLDSEEESDTEPSEAASLTQSALNFGIDADINISAPALLDLVSVDPPAASSSTSTRASRPETDLNADEEIDWDF
ncbi:hypothetical protein K438DRAFT_1771496 [Mycena galopus ATCC 62051]|nr:hypothetical protein K438DRAFT_1771496 [Mycena galopus ATCC 62051]